MSQVVAPARTRQCVNDTLLKIKAERDNSLPPNAHHNPDEIEDDSQELTQVIRPQQVYQDLDSSLNQLPRELYIETLLKLCQNEYSKVNDYRERLAERARGFPECPQTRLVNRRNSAQTTREKKCATDCYILYAFVNGERLKEIHDVFTNAQSVNVDLTLAEDDLDQPDLTNVFLKPDILTILTNIQADVSEVVKKQRSDSHLLHDPRSDIDSMTLTFRTFHSTINSILSQVSAKSSTSQITKLQDDVSKMGSSIAVMNKRFLDNKPETGIITLDEKQNEDEASTNKTQSYAEVLTTNLHVPVSNNCHTNTEIDSDAQHLVHHDIEDRRTTIADQNTGDNQDAATSNPNADVTAQAQLATPLNTISESQRHATMQDQAAKRKRSIINHDIHPRTEPEQTSNKFIAARRRKVTSYFSGNIDTSVNESDIREYLRERDVNVTHMTMFCGKNRLFGQNKRVFYEDEATVEDSNFWPERVTCRKWKSRTEWEKDRERQRRHRNERLSYRKPQYTRNSSTDEHYTHNSGRYRINEIDDYRYYDHTDDHYSTNHSKNRKNSWEPEYDDSWD